MLSLVTIDHKSSPDKIMPFPIAEKPSQDDQNSASLAGSILNLVKADTTEEQKINNERFTQNEARKSNKIVRFSEPKLLTPTGFPRQDFSTIPVSHHTRDYSNRSPLENMEAAMIVGDSTSQKKQGGSSFLPRIPSSEEPLTHLHSLGANKFEQMLQPAEEDILRSKSNIVSLGALHHQLTLDQSMLGTEKRLQE